MIIFHEDFDADPEGSLRDLLAISDQFIYKFGTYEYEDEWDCLVIKDLLVEIHKKGFYMRFEYNLPDLYDKMFRQQIESYSFYLSTEKHWYWQELWFTFPSEDVLVHTFVNIIRELKELLGNRMFE